MTACPACAKLLPGAIRYCPYCGAEVRPVAIPRAAPQLDWRFLGGWLAASLLAWGAAWGLLTLPQVAMAIHTSGTPVPEAAMAGLVTGLAQWPVLRSRLRRVPGRDRWWIVAPALAWGGTLAIYLVLLGLAGPGQPLLAQAARTTRLALIGTVAAAGQWLALRRLVPALPARHWIAVGAVAFGGMLLVTVGAAARGATLGWFPMLTFGMAGHPGFQFDDLSLASTWGWVWGGAGYFVLRGKARGAWLWPLVTGLGLLAAGVLVDLALVVTGSLAEAGTLAVGVSAGPAEQGLAWAMVGLATGLAQWRVVRGTARHSWLLVVMTVLGCTAGWGLSALALPDDWLLSSAALAGLAGGVPLWLVARSDFRQAGWLPVWSCAVWLVVTLALAGLGMGRGEQMPGPAVLTLGLAIVPGAVLAYRS